MPIIASTASAVIANAGTNSTEVDIASDQNISIWMPAAWTAATLTVQVQREGSADWFTLCDVDGPIVLTVAAAQVILLPASSLIPNGARKLRLVSSVAQGAERTLIVERRSF